MDAHAVTHPTDQTLSSYGLGRLDDRSADAVHKHLEQCSDCRKRVAEMSADSFLGRIREAQKGAGNSTFGQSQQGRTLSDRGTNAPTQPPASTLPPGLAKHPDYEITRELGRGGMGVVYLAHNRLMARDEVLKVMGQQIVEQPCVLDRFLREIRAVARLRHPNIVSAYTAFRCGESLVFAMEYVAGLDLARVVKAKGPMPVGNACNYVRQAALGLQHAHEEGMVHRDIKPGNLMLSYKGNRAVIKILDFGLAKASREQHVSDLHQDESTQQGDWVGSLTRTGQMLGTPDFIAPEQIVDAQKADIRADIYSLGCTLYCLLSGRAPFQATPHDVLQAHRSMDAKLLNVVRPEVPAELAALVAKIMAKEPDGRFQEPDDVAEALSPFFKKRSASPVPQDFWSALAAATDADRGSAAATPLATNAAPTSASEMKRDDGRPKSMWNRLIDFTENEDDLAEAAATVQPDRKGSRIYRPVVASAIGFAAILLGTVVTYRAVTDTGELVMETEDPGIELVVRQGGRLVTLVDPRKMKRVELRSGRYELAIAGDKLGLRLSSESFTLKRGEKRVVSVRRKTLPPPTSVATPKSEQLPPLVEAGSKTKQFSATKKEGKAAVAPPSEATPPAAVAGAGTAQAPMSAQKSAALGEDKGDQIGATSRRLSPFDETIDRANRGGVQFLKQEQRPDGSWLEIDNRFKTGTTSLATLALLTAGERPDSPKIRAALDYLRGFSTSQLSTTYEIALQTMVFAAAEPERDQLRIAANVHWLEGAQIRPDDPVSWPGSWSHTYSEQDPQPGDSLNSRWALLGLHAAHQAGARVNRRVVGLAREYWESCQKENGSWGFTPDNPASSATTTCAGISSLIVTDSLRNEGGEFIQGETIQNCGKGAFNPRVARGLKWLDDQWPVGDDLREGHIYKNYYLYELERAGALSGAPTFGHLYRRIAEMLVNQQSKPSGSWRGFREEHDAAATSFALLFLAGRIGPVLINKIRHSPHDDWNNDPVDVRNLVSAVSREWKVPLTSQVVDPNEATVQDLRRAPIVFFNGHCAPEFSFIAKKKLREFVDQGGILFAEACCGSAEFDQGFKRLVKEIFPEDEYRLRPLSPEHPVWRAKHLLNPDTHPLWGIEHGCRTVLIYSPMDLSCFWNQSERRPENTGVIKAIRVGQNVIDYATFSEMPADKLTVRDVPNFKPNAFKRGEFKVAKLKHAGDWNISPQAIPDLADALRKPPYKIDVVITQKDLYPRDPNLVYYPLIYIHGRAALSFSREDVIALRQHLEASGRTILADAACGSSAFDAAFRRFVAELLPGKQMVPIPHADELYTVGVDLRDIQYTKAAGGGRDYPQLEGVKFNDHWSIIYSKFDIGCALERHTGIECKGYTYESAIKIAGNIVIYSTLP